MRAIIIFLACIMFVLIGNIIAYTSSEEYRFFLKKIKYSDSVVYEEDVNLSDELNLGNNVEWWDSSNWWSPTTTRDLIGEDDFTFLDALSWENFISQQQESLPELSADEEYVLSLFGSFDLKKQESPNNLLDITKEYPDLYHEWYSKWVTLYAFSTKSYSEVQEIFEILSFDEAYTLNEVNNFWDASFFINRDEIVADGFVRIIFDYENTAFWLKIRKDRYNEIKRIMKELQEI